VVGIAHEERTLVAKKTASLARDDTAIAGLIVVILHVERSAHYRNAKMRFLVGCDFRFVNESEADIVETFQQAVLAERVDIERIAMAFVVRNGLTLKINCDLVAFLFLQTLE
jgi:hypothetical protein